jgi:hemerythrin superfamily protein
VTVSIAEQNVRELGGAESILVLQRRDHAELDRLMARYRAGRRTRAQLDRTWDDVIELVFSHAFAEETVLWPVLRRLTPDGEALTARVEEEHQQINELVARMERADRDDPRHGMWVSEVFDLIDQDIRDEEDRLLPRLRDALDQRQLRRIGATWETVRRSAPTHPHPSVSRRPPGNALAGIPLSAYDRVRDLAPAGARGPRARRLALMAGGAALAAAVLVTASRRRS